MERRTHPNRLAHSHHVAEPTSPEEQADKYELEDRTEDGHVETPRQGHFVSVDGGIPHILEQSIKDGSEQERQAYTKKKKKNTGR